MHGHPFNVCLLFLTTSLGSIELSPKFPPPPGGLQIVGNGGHVFGFTGRVEGISVIVVRIVDGMDDDSEMDDDEVVDSDF